VPTVMKVYVLRLEVAWIAPVVVCTVTPFWTTGTASVPVSAEAVGSWVICTFAMFYCPGDGLSVSRFPLSSGFCVFCSGDKSH